jgi:hypothetical protein
MQTEQLAIEVSEHNSASVWNAWDQATEQLDAAIAQPLRLVPIESEEQRNARLLRSPLVLSLANAAERRCAEAERVRNGLRAGQARMSDAAYWAHRNEANARYTNDLGLWA